MRLNAPAPTTVSTKRATKHAGYLFGGVYVATLTRYQTEALWAAAHGTFADARTQLKQPLVMVSSVRTASGDLAHQRNEVARDFLKSDARWLLSIDSDATYSPQQALDLVALADALEGDGFGIVTGITATADHEGVKGVNLFEPDEHTGIRRLKRLPDDGSVIEVAACGAHFAVYNRKALQAIQDENPNHPWPFYSSGPFVTPGGEWAWMGEDVSVCLRAGVLGWKTAAHTGIDVGHSKTMLWHARDVPDLFHPAADLEVTP